MVGNHPPGFDFQPRLKINIRQASLGTSGSKRLILDEISLNKLSEIRVSKNYIIINHQFGLQDIPQN